MHQFSEQNSARSVFCFMEPLDAPGRLLLCDPEKIESKSAYASLPRQACLLSILCRAFPEKPGSFTSSELLWGPRTVWGRWQPTEPATHAAGAADRPGPSADRRRHAGDDSRRPPVCRRRRGGAGRLAGDPSGVTRTSVTVGQRKACRLVPR